MKKIRYDETVDAAYFQIESKQVIDSEEIADGIIVDYDQDDNIVAVEILGLKTINLEHFKILKPLLPEAVQAQFQEFCPKLATASSE